MEHNSPHRANCIYDHVNVLTLTVSLPPDLSDITREFYTSLADEFELAVDKRLKACAIDAYRSCTDRRKRWRYIPWQAEFSLTPCDDGALELTVRTNNTVHIHERHTWMADTIVRRTKI